MATETQTRPVVWTVAPSTNTPYGFGRWLGETGEPAHAAYWQSRKADMIDHLAGWLETRTAQDAERKAAQGLFDQLTGVDLDSDGLNFYVWRNGVWFKKETEYAE